MKLILSLIYLILDAAPAAAEEPSAFFFPFLPEWLDNLLSFTAIIMVPVLVIVLFVGMWRKVIRTLWYVVSLQPLRRKMLRKKLKEQLLYYRDVPAKGNLKVAAAAYNSVSSAYVTDYSGLFGALILRLIDREAITVEGKSEIYGAEPHPLLYLKDWSTSTALCQHDETLEKEFHAFLKAAAGNNALLQPRELQQYIRRNKPVPFLQQLGLLTPEENAQAQDLTTAAQLLALKRFLLDFSLIGERSISEMPLWREYLVYATFFGIADKVCDDFMRLYPDYFRMNALAGTHLNIVGNQSIVHFVNAAFRDSGE